MRYLILQRAITNQMVPDNGKHVEYEKASRAVSIAMDRTSRDGITRQVVQSTDRRCVYEVDQALPGVVRATHYVN